MGGSTARRGPGQVGGNWAFLGGCKGKSMELWHFMTPEKHLMSHNVKGFGLDGKFMSLGKVD